METNKLTGSFMGNHIDIKSLFKSVLCVDIGQNSIKLGEFYNNVEAGAAELDNTN